MDARTENTASHFRRRRASALGTTYLLSMLRGCELRPRYNARSKQADLSCISSLNCSWRRSVQSSLVIYLLSHQLLVLITIMMAPWRTVFHAVLFPHPIGEALPTNNDRLYRGLTQLMDGAVQTIANGRQNDRCNFYLRYSILCKKLKNELKLSHSMCSTKRCEKFR